MALLKSISGIRGTIGGKVGENLTPLDVVKFVSAYGTLLKKDNPNKRLKVNIGRDSRVSGEMIRQLVVSTLQAFGIDIVDLGLASTPTVEISVSIERSQGGIIITASHNEKEWNALKFLNEKGEFLTSKESEALLELAQRDDFVFSTIEDLGTYRKDDTYSQKHLDGILKLPLVNTEVITQANYKVVVDGINSVGGIIVPDLLRLLGVSDIIKLNCDPTGLFSHNPEPLEKNLEEVSKRVVEEKADLGIVVDPDVDRLVFFNENGSIFGEEYTLVAVADFVLSKTRGAVVSNLSSSRALSDISKIYNCDYYSSAVGEVNVVEKMKETKAVIGGEGNGGVIYPAYHYGRDALVGIALFLTHLASKNQSMTALKNTYPKYAMIKDKIELSPDLNIDEVMGYLKNKYSSEKITDIDGVKIDFSKSWVHLRKSNTEPIVRIYAEAVNQSQADELVKKIIGDIKSYAYI
ncbi:phosphoglucosamine mutase [Ichthyobacterium seriolicida]|uniref:Phosphoglucosamine mutase n=1 Tax=Ichthyobacterium seriolicida TaxID=242600 RepID=A0A169Q483_9FLAO|nr:phosphoglucosamine mutase [Ichthyobacterium seriolicida]BAU88537.1 phosphoglucosamine mutase [Ichthyobacterium seriolicida]BAV94665.1 phosphoglucosamine mutase [Ichthyobacterium seriolicida]